MTGRTVRADMSEIQAVGIIGEHLELMHDGRRQRTEILEIRARPGETLHLPPDSDLLVRHPPEHAWLMLVGQVMQEGICPGISAQVTLEVELDVEFSRGIAIFAIAVADEMLERIDPCCCDVRIFLDVEIDVEVGKWAEPAGGPVAQIMRKRTIFRRNVIGAAIPCRVELYGWAAPFLVTIQRIMQQWLRLDCLNVGIVIEVP